MFILVNIWKLIHAHLAHGVYKQVQALLSHALICLQLMLNYFLMRGGLANRLQVYGQDFDVLKQPPAQLL